MKRIKDKNLAPDQDDILPEYDFRGMKGVRGKYYQAMRQGYTITIHKEDGTTVVKEMKPKRAVLLEHDVQQYFPDSKSVNAALRSLIPHVSSKRATMAREARADHTPRRMAKAMKQSH
jgi:peptidoglycan/xylan/chitin deacetylase (PgdA/CDA1 family)